jgi:ubiquinol-cytochrome c reductase iron-sulfur subunit
MEINRRRRLVLATSIFGATGLGFATVPFVASMLPSERAKAIGGPVEIDINRLETGLILTEEWRGKPVWVIRRTSEMLRTLEKIPQFLADPNSKVVTQQPPYVHNQFRSIKPEIFVVVGICTHLGCVPARRLEPGVTSDLGADWPGGWFCPCHGSKFDLAGRVFKNVPAPTNLVVPPHHYAGDGRIIIGINPQKNGSV